MPGFTIQKKFSYQRKVVRGFADCMLARFSHFRFWEREVEAGIYSKIPIKLTNY